METESTESIRYPLDILWEITNAVCGYDFPRIKSSRKMEEVMVRHIFWAVADEELGYSYQQLAHYCGLDHHTTVMSGLRRIRKAQQLTPLGLSTEPAVAELYWKVKKAFREEQNTGLDIITVPKYPTLAYL